MASRKDEKARLREEREERERTAAAGARRRRLVGYGAAGVLALAAIVAIVVVALAGGGGGGSQSDPVRASSDFPKSPVPTQRVSDLTAATRAAGCTTRSFPNFGRDHTTQPVTYKTNPPTSGPHNPVPAEDGLYVDAPPSEKLVHALEHGRIIVQFRPSVPERFKGQLRSLVDEDPYHMILTPNPKMPYPVAATAWRQMLGCKQPNQQVFDAIRAFRQRYRDRGPEFVP